MTWNTEQTEWSMSYRKALHLFLQQGSEASLAPSVPLGEKAAALGLETLDMALFHEKVLIPIVSPITSPTDRNALIEQATCFFMEVMVPVEKTHRGAVKSELRVAQLTKILRKRTKETDLSNRRLTRSIAQRQAAEEILRKNETSRDGEIKESGRLQSRLRKQAHTLLAAQEDERQSISLALQNETAQTLCGILIRLLSLNQSVCNSEASLQKGIDTAQHLMKKSMRRVNEL
ncbi:MAG: hypothetical protein PHG65_11920 [Kiritimatiellae bacterium]|nr:hypothetical protein [Kiritimatiellia bacterium]